MKIKLQKSTIIWAKRKILPLSIMAMVAYPAMSLTVEEDFTQGQTLNNWYLPLPGDGKAENSACLTAGSNVGVGGVSKSGSPPACTHIKESKGKGALRLTSADNYLTGGIISNTPFPSNEGVELSFTSYAYGGDGADGMAFFLVDASKRPSLGAIGASLGYSCASTNMHNRGSGIDGGYLGIGIDAYGHFTDQYQTGTGGQYGRSPNTIAIRGAGSINETFLKSKYPRNNWGQGEIQDVCESGQFFNVATQQNETILSYPLLASKVLPDSMPLYLPIKSRDEAIPISFRLKLTPDGRLSFWMSYNGGIAQPIMLDQDITKSNGPIPEKFNFGFSGSTGGLNNIHEVLCFKATPNNETSGTSNTNLPDAELTDGAQIYTALYNPLYWYGQVVAQSIVRKKDGGLAVEPVANWDAGCNLTGGDCSSTDRKNVSAQLASSRVLLTYSPNKKQGIPMYWSALDDSQQKSLAAGGKDGERHLNYLRGLRADETKKGDDDAPYFRKRIGMLGDTVNNSPTWVGPPNKIEYDTRWVDKHYSQKAMPENQGQSYATFKKEYNSRVNMVYVGANDGYLHAFRSGAYDESGKHFRPSTAKPNDGREEFAYMPASVLNRMHNPKGDGLTFSSNHYAHNYFHDATPAVGDVFYGGEWHTILLSGLGAGGSTMFALDVTDPAGESSVRKEFKNAQAQDNVLGEWSFDSKDSIWQHLGNTYGTPQFGRFHNGQWGAVFGNGWCLKEDAKNGNCTMTPKGEAGIYVMLLDEKTGAAKFRFINTYAGTPSSPNGIAYVTLADVDKDNIVDYVYAGDLDGNVWRFDLSSEDDSEWEKQPQLIFETPNGQPITTQIVFSQDKKSGNKAILNFGTGHLQMGYLTAENSYASGQQSLYGIWDEGVELFPKGSDGTTKVSAHQLQKQEINFFTNEINGKNVCWPVGNTGKCGGEPAQYGWYMDLENIRRKDGMEFEQLVFNPKNYNGTIVFNTIANGDSAIASCNQVQESNGYTYAVQAGSGKAAEKFFDNGGKREPLGGIGDPNLVYVDGQWYLISKDKQGVIEFVPVALDEDSKIVLKRLSWKVITQKFEH